MSNILNLIFILVGLIILYLVLRKDIEKFNSQNKAFDQQNFLDLVNKMMENFNILKNELYQNFNVVTEKQEKFQEKFLETTSQKQEKIVETTSKVEEIARNLDVKTEEIKAFKEILAGPKSRGYLGEIMLREILKNLPSSFYEEQYSIDSGLEKVDFVLKLNDTLIPIDAKFPIQNYYNLFDGNEKEKTILKKDLIKNLKSKIEDISKKYIKNKVEFALMYLANEAIYYELLSDKDYGEVWDFARERNVFLTSPKTFELICSSLLLIIRKQEVGENVKQILANINQLEKDLLELVEFFNRSYNQLNYSLNNLREFERILNRFIFNFKNLVKTEKKFQNQIEKEEEKKETKNLV